MNINYLMRFKILLVVREYEPTKYSQMLRQLSGFQNLISQPTELDFIHKKINRYLLIHLFLKTTNVS